MPLVFAVAILFYLVRVGQTATHQYFVNKPDVKWLVDDCKHPCARITWRSTDTDARWEVHYRSLHGAKSRTVLAHVLRRVNSEILTQHVVYDARLSDLNPSEPCEFAVYRNSMKVFSAKIPSTCSEPTGLLAGSRQ